MISELDVKNHSKSKSLVTAFNSEHNVELKAREKETERESPYKLTILC